jgi:hypothetical protein
MPFTLMAIVIIFSVSSKIMVRYCGGAGGRFMLMAFRQSWDIPLFIGVFGGGMPTYGQHSMAVMEADAR